MTDKLHSRGYYEALYKHYNALLSEQGLGIDCPNADQISVNGLSESEHDRVSYSRLLDLVLAD